MSSKSDQDNRANQLNPNNDAYYSSRGIERTGDDEDGDSDGGVFLRSYGHPICSLGPTKNPSETYTFGYGFVEESGKAHFRRVAYVTPEGLSESPENLIAKFHEDFEATVWSRIWSEFGKVNTVMSAVFDPTRMCLPWHVPLNFEDLEATRRSIQPKRVRMRADMKMPPFGRANSRGEMAPEIDPEPYLQALREAITEDTVSYGIIEVPSAGYFPLNHSFKWP